MTPLTGDVSEALDQLIVSMHREDALMFPARKLYRLTQKLLQTPVGFETFLHWIQNDKRFLVLDATPVQTKKHRLMTEEELEAIGYDTGPRVMIRSRMPDRREMLDMLVEKADRAFDSLKHAWDIRPNDDVETEDRLLNALAKAQRLQRELRLLNHELEKSGEPVLY